MQGLLAALEFNSPFGRQPWRSKNEEVCYDAFKFKAKPCCSKEYERLVRRLGACEMESNTAGERHACYRKTAKVSGLRAKACSAAGNT